MITSIRVDRDLPMKTRDGIVLKADVYRPDDGKRYPAIVSRTPYNKLLGGNNDYLSAVQAAFAGYAYVLQDTRGRFASEGSFTPSQPEGPDGYDAVEWAASEPWCDGRVAMAGGSYLGRIQWQTAVEQPPSLKAIAPAIIYSGPIPESLLSGVMDFEQAVSWYSGMTVEMINRLEREGQDVSRMREMIGRALGNIDEVLEYLPFNDVPHFNFEGLREGFSRRTADFLLAQVNEEADLFWEFDKVQVPCFQAGGWYDMYCGSLFASFHKMREMGATDIARQGQHIFCGPWVHGRSLPAYSGALHFGPTAAGVTSFAPDRQLAFFDRYVKEMDIEIPPVRYFVMGLNRWRTAETWPLPETSWTRFFLSGKGRANAAAGDGVLTTDAPGAQPPDTFDYDPIDPVRTVGGRCLPSGKLVPGPFNQIQVEKRRDVLCYTTGEMKSDVEVTGPVEVHLFAATSAKDTDFVAKLVDVYPDGSAYNVAEGIIRARYRNGVLQPSFVTPGEVNEYIISLASVSIGFKKGHRIRLDITSSNFPRFDRNMNTGNAFGVDARGVVANQTVFHDDTYASYVTLPVVESVAG